MSIKLLDRELKANLEVKVINKETLKSKSVSLHSEDENEESLFESIKQFLQQMEKTS